MTTRCRQAVVLSVARRRRRSVVSGVALLLLALSAVLPKRAAWADSAPDFVVIINPNNPNAALNRDFLVEAFLKRTTRWDDGELLHPVDQRFDSLVRRRFSESVLQRSAAAVKNYWQQRIFSGRDLPPPELDSDDAVVAYVVKNRGAIGYISGSAKLDRAKPVVVR